MHQSAAIEFDETPRGAPASSAPATERIAATLREAGVDAPNSLYDEALAFAREGHLGQAHARLQMLICLDPDDADAHLLLAKVLAAQGRPTDALARLESAVGAGAFPPAGFREQLEAGIRVERAREEEHRARLAAREQGEIRSLRHETRTLRSDNVRLEAEVTETRVRERNWKYAAFGVSLVGTLVILVLTATGGPKKAEPAVETTPVLTAAPVEAAPVAVVEQAPKPVVKPPSKPEAVAPVAPVAEKVAAKPVEKPAEKAAEKAANGKPPGGVHVVESGDTLYKLAARYYGDASQWERIQKANKSVLKNGKDLSLGMKLKIP